MTLMGHSMLFIYPHLNFALLLLQQKHCFSSTFLRFYEGLGLGRRKRKEKPSQQAKPDTPSPSPPSDYISLNVG